MRLNISITNADEKEIINMLWAFAEQVAQERRLPNSQVLMDSTPHCCGSVYTTGRKD